MYDLSSAATSILILMAQMLWKPLWCIHVILVYILLHTRSLVLQYCSTWTHLQDSLLKVHSCFDGELQNHRIVWVGKDLTDHLVPIALLWIGTTFTRPGCWKSHLTWSWTLLGMGHLYLFWAIYPNITFTVDNFFLTSHLDLCSISLKQFALVLSLPGLVKSLSPPLW